MTKLTRARKFFPSHDKHQDFMAKNPFAQCSHRIMFNWKKILAVQAAVKKSARSDTDHIASIPKYKSEQQY